MATKLADDMIQRLKSIAYHAKEHGVFNDCCDATRPGIAKIAKERNAARQRLIAHLNTPRGKAAAIAIGFLSSEAPKTDAATPQDRKLAIDVARVALHAVPFTYDDDGRRWAYFAEETRSWWAITTDAMIQLADMLAANRATIGGGRNPADVVSDWAEADNTAIELDRDLQRRLGLEHGR